MNIQIHAAPFVQKVKTTELNQCSNAKTNPNTFKALERAVEENNYEKIKELLESGVDPKQNNSKVLSDAVWYNNFEVIKLLLDYGANAKDCKLIPSPAARGLFDIVQILLVNGADPTVENSLAVKLAFAQGHMEIVNLLIAHGADPLALKLEQIHQWIQKGNLAELIATHNTGEIDFNNLDIVKWMLYSTIYDIVKFCLEHLSNAQKLEIDFDHLIYISMNSFAVTKLLFENIDIKKLENIENIFLKAVNIGNTECVKLLLQEIELKEEIKSEAFIIAFLKNYNEIMDSLITSGINPEVFIRANIIKCINKNDLDEFIAKHKSGEFDFDNLKIVNLILYSMNYSFINYALNNISDNKKLEMDLSSFLISSMDNYEIISLVIEKIDICRMKNIQQIFIKAAEVGNIEVVKLLLQQNIVLAREQQFEAFKLADLNNFTPVTELLLEKGLDPLILVRSKVAKMIDKDYTENLLHLFQTGEIDYSQPEIIREVFLSADYSLVKYLFENLPKLKNAYLIGVGISEHPSHRSEANANLLRSISHRLKNKENAYYVDLSIEIANDEGIMQYCSGFISSSESDNYPSDGRPLIIDNVKYDEMLVNEQVSAQILKVAKNYEIPYLGICAGAQNLILGNQGYLKRGGHRNKVDIDLLPGTISHYLFLDEKEKLAMLSGCKLPTIELKEVLATHDYSAYIDHLGEGLKLGGVSKKNIPVAYSLGTDKIGVQFHPEMLVNIDEPVDSNRYNHFFDNIFGMFENFHFLMQNAKAMGIDKNEAKEIIQKANKELLDKLENCMTQVTISMEL